MSRLENAFSAGRIANIMQDTWGHTYPEPGRKYPGYIVFSVGDYGDHTILKAEFEDLQDSPIKESVCDQIFDEWDVETGVYRVDCELWFFKNCHDLYTSDSPVGKIIKQKIRSLVDL